MDEVKYLLNFRKIHLEKNLHKKTNIHKVHTSTTEINDIYFELFLYYLTRLICESITSKIVSCFE